jgi:DNA-directed RNA polymerase sigma subunit (sigma70/sigma32)
MSLSRERVRQLEKEALKRLRERAMSVGVESSDAA